MFRFPFSRPPSNEPIRKQWLCVSCLQQVSLDPHGRCGNCGSDAVDRIINFDAPDHRPRGVEARFILKIQQ